MSRVRPMSFQSLGRDSARSNRLLVDATYQVRMFQSLGRDSARLTNSPTPGPHAAPGFNRPVAIQPALTCTRVQLSSSIWLFQSLGRDSARSSQLALHLLDVLHRVSIARSRFSPT